MRTKVQKCGNSLASVWIPKSPTRREYTLEDLVSGITPENRHAEVDLGRRWAVRSCSGLPV